MPLFAEYVEKRRTRELAELCVQHGIDLAPLVEKLDGLMRDTDLDPEEIYNEFLQQAANWAGNLAGKAVKGIGNLTNNFMQGWRQGRKPQQSYQPQVQQGMPQQGRPMGIESEEPSIQGAVSHLEALKRNLQVIANSNTKFGYPSADAIQRSAMYVGQISQMIQKVLMTRHNIAYKPGFGFEATGKPPGFE